MNDVRITLIEEDDAEALVALYDQLQPTAAKPELTRATIRRMRDDARHVYLGARLEGVLVGTLMGAACQMLYGQARSFMVVEDVVVHRDHRRSGIGRLLMRAIEGHAQRLDCSYIILMTDADRPGSVAFYEELGYQHTPYVGFKRKVP